jgi:hypothetical protein
MVQCILMVYLQRIHRHQRMDIQLQHILNPNRFFFSKDALMIIVCSSFRITYNHQRHLLFSFFFPIMLSHQLSI